MKRGLMNEKCDALVDHSCCFWRCIASGSIPPSREREHVSEGRGACGTDVRCCEDCGKERGQNRVAKKETVFRLA